ncbi:MAG: hypothetical protein PHX38_10100 [Sulfuricella sp.]|nr:hypothetical protein [Sulfuricella sp.]
MKVIMKRISLIILSMLVLGLTGCGQQQQDKQKHSEKEKDQASKNVMGDGNRPMPTSPIGGL